jgi:hypothetical protein
MCHSITGQVLELAKKKTASFGQEKYRDHSHGLEKKNPAGEEVIHGFTMKRTFR